jgi:hypothetical protein
MRHYEVRRRTAVEPEQVRRLLTDADRLVAAGTGTWRSMPDLQPSFDTFADALAHAAERAR